MHLTPACQLQVDLPGAESPHNALAALFAEELGLLLEVAPEHEAAVCSAYAAQGLQAAPIGRVSAERGVSVSVGGQPCISGALPRSCALCAQGDDVDMLSCPGVRSAKRSLRSRCFAMAPCTVPGSCLVCAACT